MNVILNRFIKTAGIFLIIFAWSNSTIAATIQECEVSGGGIFPGGVMFDGAYSDLDGIETIDWTHDELDASFVTTAVVKNNPGDGFDFDGIVCRQNGRITGTVTSSGTGTFNGVPGYDYYLYMEDNRPAPDSVLVVASITYYPTDRNNGTVSFVAPRTVEIPAEIAVTVGGSGKGKTRLILDGIVTCTYRGTGTSYTFDRCSDPLDSGYLAGDNIDVSQIQLRIQQADREFSQTSVELDFGVGPAPGTPDFYQLVVFFGSEEEYRFGGSLVDGDIAVTLLGGTSVP